MAEFIKQSWLFPVIQSIHLIGLVMMVGTISLVDLCALGIGVRTRNPANVAALLAPWTSGGLLTVLITGPLMFGSDLTRYLHNPAFIVKMGLLALALAGHFTLHRTAISQSRNQKLAAVVSLILWSSVVLAGRAIADFDIRQV